MPINVNCVFCRKNFDAPDDQKGKRIVCPHCKNPVLAIPPGDTGVAPPSVRRLAAARRADDVAAAGVPPPTAGHAVAESPPPPKRAEEVVAAVNAPAPPVASRAGDAASTGVLGWMSIGAIAVALLAAWAGWSRYGAARTELAETRDELGRAETDRAGAMRKIEEMSAELARVEEAKLTAPYANMEEWKAANARWQVQRDQWLQPPNNMVDDDLKALARLPAHMQHSQNNFNLQGRGITDEGVAHLVRLPNLQHLNIHNTQIGNAGLEAIAKLRSLNHLSLVMNPNVTDEGMAFLADLPELQGVNLVGSENITPAGLERLAASKSLTNLTLSPNLATVEGLKHLARLPRLIHLNFHDWNRPAGTPVSVEALALLADFPALTSVTIPCTPESVGGLKLLKRPTSLTLMIQQTADGFPALVVDSLAELGQLTQLNIFSHNTDFVFSGEELARLAESLPGLQQLGIPVAGGAGLGALSEMKSLNNLSLFGASGPTAGLTDEDVEFLAALPRLQHLNLNNASGLTDAAVKTLAALPALQRLQLYNARQITSAILPDLAGAPSLQWIQIQGSGITREEADRVRSDSNNRKHLNIW